MSDSLKDRLSSHSNSFEGLLSLIPARYYYDDESNSQWQRKGANRQEERKNEAIQHKQNKFDPDHGTSALDEVKRRENAAREAEDGDLNEDGAEDDGDVVVYDDYGNPIGEQKELSVAELLKAKANGQDTGADAPKETKPKETKAKATKNDAKKEAKSALKTKEAKPKEVKPKEVKPKETSKDDQNGSKDTSAASGGEEQQPAAAPAASDKSKGIEELRAKLAARVNELKTKRKAPGSDATGAFKNREELLAARKQRLEQKKHNKKPEEVVEEDNDNDDEEDETIDSDMSSIAESDPGLIFGQIQFNDGARLGKSGSAFEQQRNLKKRNAIDQLKVLEHRRTKVGKLDKDKQREIAENAKWSRAILQSEGAKVRDDEKLLRRTVKQQQNQKKRSEKEWKQRIYNVKKGISDREAKRNSNLRAHKEAKKMRLKGKKRRDHMKSATR